MKKHTLKIVLAAYFITMVIAISIFNGEPADKAVGDAVHAQAGDGTHQEVAVESQEDEKKAAEKQAYLTAALESIASVDHRVPVVAGNGNNPFAGKPSPDMAIAKLQQGNDRFVAGEMIYPNLNAERLAQAGSENQGDHAFATVITCSDSRVPVESLFDAGIMDIFVVRVAGNVCDVDERGSIEYGLAHVKTPVLVVLGHTQCGAVTAVTHAVQGRGHALERNIPALVDNIEPAVRKAMALHPDLKGDAVIPAAIEENIWLGIEELFMESPVIRGFVKEKFAKVVGAVYDVGTGKVTWLPEDTTFDILEKVEANPNKAILEGGAQTHGDSHS